MATAKVELVAIPDDFDGTNLEDFLSQVDLYLFGHETTLNTDDKKVLFTLGRFKEGLAMTFRMNYLREKKTAAVPAVPGAVPPRPARAAGYAFDTWEDFKILLNKTFQDPNEMRKKQQKLELLRQGTRAADAFYLEFEQVQRKSRLCPSLTEFRNRGIGV